MKAISTISLISILFVSTITSKLQQIISRPTRSIFDEINDSINQILESQTRATYSSLQTVNAFSKAVATCEVNVACDEAKRRYEKTETFVNIASKSFSESVAAAKSIRETVVDAAIPVQAVKSSQEAADLAAKQSGLALEATAIALAGCEVILHLVCEQCPSGVEVLETTSSRANRIIDDIRNQLKDLF